MQHGESHLPIVGDLKGVCHYYRRTPYVQWHKKAAHRAHRHRIASDLKLVAREALDSEDFEGQPVKSEACDSWDIW